MHNRLISSYVISMIHLGIVVLLLCPSFSRGQEPKLTDLNISMTLINLKDKSSTNLTNEEVKLNTSKIIFNKNDSIQKLLTSNGIYADGESIGIIYQLNPSMNLKSIKDGEQIILPIIKINRQLASSSTDGYLVALTHEYKIKKDFAYIIKQLEVAVDRMPSLNIERYLPPEIKDKFIVSTRTIVDNMGVFKALIRERTRSLNSEMIQQMHDEAEQIITIIDKITHNNYKLTKNDIESVALIANNMDIRMKAFDEAKGTGEVSFRWPEVSVIVRAIDVNQGREINNLRVYYVAQGLWNERIKYEKSFDKLTSPSERNLPEADYYIWVGKPKDSTPLSERKSLEVREKAEKEKVQLDLSVK